MGAQARDRLTDLGEEGIKMAIDLPQFIETMRARIARASEPADCVTAIAPWMQELIDHAKDILRPEHYRRNPEHYARNPVHIDAQGGLSLFSMAWSPGQWTPIHDHGTWGVVGVVEGVLEERNYIRVDDRRHAFENIALARGGVTLMGPGTVTSFVPNPDHIHVTGVADNGPGAVSLHLYGRVLNDYHIYDREKGTRRLISVGMNQE
jgi:predicted metal-dependent enzyme (double-stranded beta helix superfamily)